MLCKIEAGLSCAQVRVSRAVESLLNLFSLLDMVFPTCFLFLMWF